MRLPRLAAATALTLAGTLLPAVLGVTSAGALEVPAPVAGTRGPAVDGGRDAGTTRQATRRVPRLRVSVRAGGFDHPWDVKRLPGEGLLVSERERKRLTLLQADGRRVLDFPGRRVWASGETGLMGLEVDPRFRDNRRFYVCQGGSPGGTRHDVRVLAFKLSDDATRARQVAVLLRGIDASSGRHGGCRLLITRGGALLVGTGDAAVGRNPQDRTSLAGTVLRMNRFSGEPLRTNPWARASSTKKRYVLTYGHRNVQGLAQRADGSLWSVEHGPDRDDEVNRLRPGGNYGWDPRPGYDESVPMTDFSLPGKQVAARWRSGDPTVAASGATFVRGTRWGAYRGRLAVAALKDQQMLFLRFDGRGTFQGARVPAALAGKARLRSVTQLPGGALLVTTDGREGGDRVLKVVPVRR